MVTFFIPILKNIFAPTPSAQIEGKGERIVCLDLKCISSKL